MQMPIFKSDFSFLTDKADRVDIQFINGKSPVERRIQNQTACDLIGVAKRKHPTQSTTLYHLPTMLINN